MLFNGLLITLLLQKSVTTKFFIDLIITLLGFAILSISYFGWGWASSRTLKLDLSSKEKPFVLIWLGWAITLFLLQVINLLVPITAVSSIFLLVLGTTFAVIFFRAEFRDHKLPAVPWIFLVLVTIAALWIAVIAMASPTWYDSGLYYFNSIRWLNERSIVLGLANLHNRLAFNESFFTYVSFLNLYPFFKHGYNLANSFLWLVLFAECLLPLLKYFSNKDSRNTESSFASILPTFFIPILAYVALTTSVSSPMSDVASALLQIMLFIQFVTDIDENLSDKGNNSRLAFIFILSATAITIKLSNLSYVLTICVILLFIRTRFQIPDLKRVFRAIIRLLVLPALILGIWSLRGVLSSGCPLYPSTFGCLGVTWAEPTNLVKSDADLITSWAREPEKTPDQVLGSWKWLEPWANGIVHDHQIDVMYPFTLSILAILAGILLFALSSNKKIDRIYSLIPLPILAGLIYWFGLAPNPRFAIALFWLLPISVIAVIAKILEASQKYSRGILLALLLLVNASILWHFVQRPQMFTKFSTAGYLPIPTASLKVKTTLSGLDVLTPTKSDQCWDSQLPCTPYFNENLNFIDNAVFPEFTTGR